MGFEPPTPMTRGICILARMFRWAAHKVTGTRSAPWTIFLYTNKYLTLVMLCYNGFRYPRIVCIASSALSNRSCLTPSATRNVFA
jgi:hypothetical protein